MIMEEITIGDRVVRTEEMELARRFGDPLELVPVGTVKALDTSESLSPPDEGVVLVVWSRTLAQWTYVEDLEPAPGQEVTR